MEILIGVISTGITELIKIISKNKKISIELSKKIVHSIVFVLVLVGTLLINKGIISWDIILNYVEIFSVSYASYRLIVKPAKNLIIK